jgi:hypothetical protein
VTPVPATGNRDRWYLRRRHPSLRAILAVRKSCVLTWHFHAMVFANKGPRVVIGSRFEELAAQHKAVPVYVHTQWQLTSRLPNLSPEVCLTALTKMAPRATSSRAV